VIVPETSAMVEFLVGSDPVADRVRDALTGQVLAAPHSIDLECASTLRGLVLGHKVPADEAARALDLLGRMNIQRYGHVALLSRIWQLRENAWPYDAAYMALAESLNADLITVDGKFETVPGLRCTVRNLRDR
jgi:predicted nucleic acid-binding protein